MNAIKKDEPALQSTPAIAMHPSFCVVLLLSRDPPFTGNQDTEGLRVDTGAKYWKKSQCAPTQLFDLTSD